MRVVKILLFLIAVGYAFWLMAHYPGYMMLSLGGYRLQTTLWMGLACLFLSALLLRLFWMLLTFPVRIKKGWRQWRGQSAKPNRLLLQALESLFEGAFVKASRKGDHLSKQAKPYQSIGMGLSAISTYFAGDQKRCLEICRHPTKAEFMPVLLRAWLLDHCGEEEEAYHALLGHDVDGGHQGVLSALVRMSAKLKRHQDCMDWLKIMTQRHGSIASEVEEQAVWAHAQRLQTAEMTDRDHIWQETPLFCRYRVECLEPYVAYLVHQGEGKKAQRLIKKAHKQVPNSDTILLMSTFDLAGTRSLF